MQEFWGKQPTKSRLKTFIKERRGWVIKTERWAQKVSVWCDDQKRRKKFLVVKSNLSPDWLQKHGQCIFDRHIHCRTGEKTIEILWLKNHKKTNKDFFFDSYLPWLDSPPELDCRLCCPGGWLFWDEYPAEAWLVVDEFRVWLGSSSLTTLAGIELGGPVVVPHPPTAPPSAPPTGMLTEPSTFGMTRSENKKATVDRWLDH